MVEELHQPRAPSGDGLVLTHGAGGNARAPLLVALGEAFAARGLTVLRYDLPFRQASRTAPPRPSGAARDREGLRTAVTSLKSRLGGRVFLGGQSCGGRQASMLAAGEAGLIDGLLLLSYPLAAFIPFGSIIQPVVYGALLHLVMVFRGHLFAALDGTSHRQRMYKYRSTGAA